MIVAPSKPLETGRSIIELMIAIAIASIITLGITAIYGAASKSTRSATQQGALSEDAALALHLIGQGIKRAGYGEIVGTDLAPANQTLFAFDGILACNSGSFNNPATGDFTCVAGSAIADSLLVQFQSDAIAASTQRDTRNCTGGAGIPTVINQPDHPANGASIPVVQNVYTLTGGNLTCSGNQSPGIAMASQVEEFKVFFGYDEAAADAWNSGNTLIAPSASIIVDADFIRAKQAGFRPSTVTAWNFVVSVHLCAVAKTKERGTSVDTNVQYEGCPQTPAEVVSGGVQKTATDGAVRKTYKQNYTVRANATASPAVRPL